MPKYLVEVRYTHNGLEGVLAKGGSTRAEAATTVVESVGGKVEALDFGFGQTDAYVLVDLPDNSAAAAVALTVGASGRATLGRWPS